MNELEHDEGHLDQKGEDPACFESVDVGFTAGRLDGVGAKVTLLLIASEKVKIEVISLLLLLL